MDSLPPTIFIALGTLIAAFITGAVSLVNLVISKEQKISELRQVWINDLRNEISEFIGLANSLYVSWVIIIEDAVHEEDNAIQYLKENKESIRKIDALAHRIKLRLNPNEYQELIKTIDDIESHYSSQEGLSSSGDIHSKFKCLHDQTQVVLKTEWERVKSGESGYILLKRTALSVVTATILIGVLWYIFKIA